MFPSSPGYFILIHMSSHGQTNIKAIAGEETGISEDNVGIAVRKDIVALGVAVGYDQTLEVDQHPH